MQFASLLFLALATVMFIVQYELMPVSGRWNAPGTKNTGIAAVVMEPDHDIEVEVTPPKGFEHGKWGLWLQDSDMVFAVAAEDQKDSKAFKRKRSLLCSLAGSKYLSPGATVRAIFVGLAFLYRDH